MVAAAGTTVVSTERLSLEARAILSNCGVVEANYSSDDLEKAAVLLTWPGKVPSKQILSRMKQLRAIQFVSAGVDDVPFELISPSVRLYSNAGAYSEYVAEHAWALILALAKGIFRKVGDDSSDSESYPIFRRTLAVLGCGGIGSRVASVGGSAFGMKTVGLSRTFKEPERFQEKYYALETDLAKVLSAADVLVLALPVNQVTNGLLDYETLKKNTKPNVIIVNVARAELVNEKGLLRFLRENQGARFGTDVFWRDNEGRERFDSQLLKLKNFIGTEHKAGFGANSESKDIAMLAAAENVKRFLETGSAANEIKREDYS